MATLNVWSDRERKRTGTIEIQPAQVKEIVERQNRTGPATFQPGAKVILKDGREIRVDHTAGEAADLLRWTPDAKTTPAPRADERTQEESAAFVPPGVNP